MNKIFHIGSTFKAFEEDDTLHITGMASTNGTDRVGDIIETEAWTKGGLDNYLNNPVILFNHDYNQPIGRAVQLGTNDNGLQLKAKIAKSAGHVGELIKEGVLGAFSVGFRVKDADYMVETDGYKIKDAELLEVSVVTVPANQAATFSLAKSFDSETDYEEFKKSFKHEDSSEKHVLNVQETEDKVTVEFAKEHDESMPKGLDESLAQEKTMSDIDIDAIVASAVEKTATAMAMKEAERKAEEAKALEAEQKAADEAATQKAADEARIVTAVQSGTEKLVADLEAKFAEKDADYARIVGELKTEITEKSEEIQKMRDSKRVFADRADARKGLESMREEALDAHFLGVITQKGLDTKMGRDIMEKVNTDSGIQVSASTSADFESFVSTEIERDIQLELVLDNLFRKVNMTAASMVVPLMPDAGYAEWNNSVGKGSGNAPHGNLTTRGDAYGTSPADLGGIDMTSKVLTASKLISNSYLVNETEEDAIMPILPLIREAMVRSHARAIEHSLLMGGATDDLIATPYQGLVKIAADDSKTVVALDTSPISQDLQAPADDLLKARKAMGKYGRRPGDVVFIVSLDYYFNLLEDPDFQTINEVGDQRATRVTGEIGNIYGSPVIVCDEFPAAATGKPCAVAVNTRNFVVPVLRGVTIEQDYEVANQRRVLVASQRRGFDQMFTEAGQVVVVNYD
jgi:HK97 family phage prohead protease